MDTQEPFNFLLALIHKHVTVIVAPQKIHLKDHLNVTNLLKSGCVKGAAAMYLRSSLGLKPFPVICKMKYNKIKSPKYLDCELRVQMLRKVRRA